MAHYERDEFLLAWDDLSLVKRRPREADLHELECRLNLGLQDSGTQSRARASAADLRAAATGFCHFSGDAVASSTDLAWLSKYYCVQRASCASHQDRCNPGCRGSAQTEAAAGASDAESAKGQPSCVKAVNAEQTSACGEEPALRLAAALKEEAPSAPCEVSEAPRESQPAHNTAVPEEARQAADSADGPVSQQGGSDEVKLDGEGRPELRFRRLPGATAGGSSLPDLLRAGMHLQENKGSAGAGAKQQVSCAAECSADVNMASVAAARHPAAAEAIPGGEEATARGVVQLADQKQPSADSLAPACTAAAEAAEQQGGPDAAVQDGTGAPFKAADSDGDGGTVSPTRVLTGPYSPATEDEASPPHPNPQPHSGPGAAAYPATKAEAGSSGSGCGSSFHSASQDLHPAADGGSASLRVSSEEAGSVSTAFLSPRGSRWSHGDNDCGLSRQSSGCLLDTPSSVSDSGEEEEEGGGSSSSAQLQGAPVQDAGGCGGEVQQRCPPAALKTHLAEMLRRMCTEDNDEAEDNSGDDEAVDASPMMLDTKALGRSQARGHSSAGAALTLLELQAKWPHEVDDGDHTGGPEAAGNALGEAAEELSRGKGIAVEAAEVGQRCSKGKLREAAGTLSHGKGSHEEAAEEPSGTCEEAAETLNRGEALRVEAAETPGSTEVGTQVAGTEASATGRDTSNLGSGSGNVSAAMPTKIAAASRRSSTFVFRQPGTTGSAPLSRGSSAVSLTQSSSSSQEADAEEGGSSGPERCSGQSKRSSTFTFRQPGTTGSAPLVRGSSAVSLTQSSSSSQEADAEEGGSSGPEQCSGQLKRRPVSQFATNLSSALASGAGLGVRAESAPHQRAAVPKEAPAAAAEKPAACSCSFSATTCTLTTLST